MHPLWAAEWLGLALLVELRLRGLLPFPSKARLSVWSSGLSQGLSRHRWSVCVCIDEKDPVLLSAAPRVCPRFPLPKAARVEAKEDGTWIF